MARYPYLPLPTGSGIIYKPIIPVRFSNEEANRRTPRIKAIVDSGADVCFCSKNIGLWLGVKLTSKPERFLAVNNQPFQAFAGKVTMTVWQTTYDCPFYFSDLLPEEFPVILGQNGFFDRFHVCFDLKNLEIEIR